MLCTVSAVLSMRRKESEGLLPADAPVQHSARMSVKARPQNIVKRARGSVRSGAVVTMVPVLDFYAVSAAKIVSTIGAMSVFDLFAGSTRMVTSFTITGSPRRNPSSRRV